MKTTLLSFRWKTLTFHNTTTWTKMKKPKLVNKTNILTSLMERLKFVRNSSHKTQLRKLRNRKDAFVGLKRFKFQRWLIFRWEEIRANKIKNPKVRWLPQIFSRTTNNFRLLFLTNLIPLFRLTTLILSWILHKKTNLFYRQLIRTSCQFLILLWQFLHSGDIKVLSN